MTSPGLIACSARTLPVLRLAQPTTVAEAVACLAADPGSVVLAGGTDLVARFNEGLMPSVLVDLSRLPALHAIRRDGSVLGIGAAVTHARGCTHAEVHRAAPGFARAWARIANPRIRQRATLGGNLMARRTRYEASVLLSALDARLQVATSTGSVPLAPAALWDGALPAAALLTDITLDTQDLLGFHYERSLRPLMTQALALYRYEGGVRLSLALATEYLAPVRLQATWPALTREALRAQARRVAGDLFATLPPSFHDPVVTPAYARQAGAALLVRQLEAIDD